MTRGREGGTVCARPRGCIWSCVGVGCSPLWLLQGSRAGVGQGGRYGGLIKGSDVVLGTVVMWGCQEWFKMLKSCCQVWK